MNKKNARKRKNQRSHKLQPFRRAVLRGFGVMLPPLLTVVILLWIGNSVQKFVLNPVEWASRQAIVLWYMSDTDSEAIEAAATNSKRNRDRKSTPSPQPTADTEQTELEQLAAAVARIEQKIDGHSTLSRQSESRSDRREHEGELYVKLPDGEWIPAYIQDEVQEYISSSGIPLTRETSKGYFDYYVEHRVLRKGLVIPVFVAGFILVMYLLGKFLAAGIGRILWNSLESVITQLPIIRTVYNSVKQVTDFFVGESDIDFQRVVAVEYPRKGAWSIGFVTGESLFTIRGAADEAVVSVLMPTSPVPGTGFTITVRKSETIDLDIPIEQALQFVVSCGVVVPENEVGGHHLVKEQLEAAANQRLLESGSGAGM